MPVLLPWRFQGWPAWRSAGGYPRHYRSAAAGRCRVLNNDSETVLDVYINLKQGARIPDVAGEVQRSVKVAVQSMTGKPVTKVNVHVVGLSLEDDKA